MADLKALLDPISTFVAGLDAARPREAEAALNARFPATSAEIQDLRTAAFAALAAGAICNRGDAKVRFSRVVKPEHDPGGCSVDAVSMDDAAGPAHTHTKGEFCLCFADTGSPTFEGRGDTWIVMPRGSRHVPTVKGGRMLILYWLPEGAVVWG